jgi:peptidoglycan glycosyltransferase
MKKWIFSVVGISCSILLFSFLQGNSEVEKANKPRKVALKQRKECLEPRFVNLVKSDFRFQYELFKKSKVINGRYIYNNGIYEVTFTVNPLFQQRIKREFKRFKLKYASFVAIEPKTGKVIAAVSGIDYPNLLFKRNFPTASTFKIVTAAAALDSGLANPKTELVCGGVGDSCSPYVWLNSKLQIRRRFSDSFATSANPFFGNLGRLIGKDRLLKYAELFGFNRRDYNFPWGRIDKPKGDYEIALTAAGLGRTTTSPFHEALISQVILNGGVMMKPYIVESIKDLRTGKVYKVAPTPIQRVISEKTAKEIEDMMRLTTKIGTVSDRRYFRVSRRYRELEIGGKTGTLSELSYPEGRCEWFTGFIKYGNQQLAVSSVAVNGKLYYLSGYEITALAGVDFAKLNLKFAREGR